MALPDNPRSLVFYLAYPGPGNLDGHSRSLIETQYLYAALEAVLEDDAFEALELTSLKPKKQQQRVAEMLKKKGKRVAFHCEPVQWVNEEGLIDPADLSCTSEVQRVRAVDRIRRLVEHLRLWPLAESLGGVKSLLCHPATMTHASVPADRRHALGITDGLVRISAGLEDIDDLKDDLTQALDRV